MRLIRSACQLPLTCLVLLCLQLLELLALLRTQFIEVCRSNPAGLRAQLPLLLLAQTVDLRALRGRRLRRRAVLNLGGTACLFGCARCT